MRLVSPVVHTRSTPPARTRGELVQTGEHLGGQPHPVPTLSGHGLQSAAPTLLITGENGYVPAGELDEMRRRRPDVRHVQVPGAGHDVHLDAPERVAELVRGFAA